MIVPKADAAVGEHDLLEFLGTRLARYKIPKAVVFAPELPRNATGKLLKQTIRARYGKS